MLYRACGLPQAWRQQPQWRVLDTSFGQGLRFLGLWLAWQQDPDRPRLLHYCAIEATPFFSEDVVRASQGRPELSGLAAQLAEQCYGLLPGFHRIALEDGRVLLTLCIGDLLPVLRALSFSTDSLLMTHWGAEPGTEAAEVHILKAVARCCVRGTRFATAAPGPASRSALAGLTQCGFTIMPSPSPTPDLSAASGLQGVFNPSWEPRRRHAPPKPIQAGHCVVIGAGLAGAAVANRLAQRGWQVLVLDAARQPAQGASALPAGLLAAQVSPDDGVQSQISRCGVRATLRQASQLLQQGIDWQHTGVLEHRVNGQTGLPGPWPAVPALALARASREWSQAATAAQLEAAHLPAQTAALWHQPAAWIKPAALVKALLQHPNIRFEGDRRADALQRTDSQWGVVDARGQCMALAPLVIITAAHGSQSLLAGVPGAAVPALQALRGQVSWGRRQRAIGGGADADADAEQSRLPPFPVNGLGSLIPAVPDGADLRWALGASYERDEDEVTTSALQRAGRHRENLQRLRGLLPEAARVLASQLAGSPGGSSGGAATNGVEPGLDLDSEQAEAFVGIRCASRDRLPLVGPVYATPTGQGRAQTDALQPNALDGLWLCTAMGSRGLTLALLCADLLAARLHGEPWPLEQRLGLALDTAR